MSDLHTAIETLEEAGFVAGMKTPEGQFYHRDINGDEEVAIHVTSSAYPESKPGVNIWLQDGHNARPKQRTDIFLGDPEDFLSEMLDKIACMEAYAADTTVEAVSILQKRVGDAYADMAHPAFPADHPKPHRDFHRVLDYMRSARNRVADRVYDGSMPELAGRITPSKVYKNVGFKISDRDTGYTRRERFLEDVCQEIMVMHVSSFDIVQPNEILKSEGYVVSVFDKASGSVSFQKHLSETGNLYADQERAFMLAAGLDGSRKSFVADGADFLASVLVGENADTTVAFKAFDMMHEEAYEALGEGDDELLWWQFLDDLHERTFGFCYGVTELCKESEPDVILTGP